MLSRILIALFALAALAAWVIWARRPQQPDLGTISDPGRWDRKEEREENLP